MPSAEAENILDPVLRDRSHIDETLRLAAEENAGNYAGEERFLSYIYNFKYLPCFLTVVFFIYSSCFAETENDLP